MVPFGDRAATVHTPWLGVEVRHLAALSAIAETGSFRRAALHLGYVQSAISNQIAALERAVGARLIERSSGPGTIALTGAGELMLQHAGAMLARLDAARADVEALLAGAEVVRIGAGPAAARWILPDVLAALEAERADLVPVGLELDGGCDAAALLASGVIDLALVPTPDGESALDALELNDSLRLVSPVERRGEDPVAAVRRAVTGLRARHAGSSAA